MISTQKTLQPFYRLKEETLSRDEGGQCSVKRRGKGEAFGVPGGNVGWGMSGRIPGFWSETGERQTETETERERRGGVWASCITHVVSPPSLPTFWVIFGFIYKKSRLLKHPFFHRILYLLLEFFLRTKHYCARWGAGCRIRCG